MDIRKTIETVRNIIIHQEFGSDFVNVLSIDLRREA